jgi:hypothetical protein
MNKKLALIAALVLVTPVLASFSVQAQTSPTNATTNSQLTNSTTANALGVTTGTPTTSQQQTSNRSPTTGVICIEEMTATFCNVPSGPNTNGRIARRIWIGQRDRLERRIGIDRWFGIGCGERRRCRQYIFHPGLRRLSNGQRVVQLICNCSDESSIVSDPPDPCCRFYGTRLLGK